MSPNVLLAIFRIIGISARAVNDFLDKNGPHLAAAVSYYALFSLFPLSLAILSGLSFILGPDAVDGLAVRIAEQAPVSNQAVSEALSSIVGSRSIAGLTGIIGLLWAGTAVFGAIRKGVNTTWGITKPRPFLQERLIDISLMLAATVLMLISISSTAVLAYLREIIEFITLDAYVNEDFLWDRLASLIPPTLSFLVFSGLYWFLPNTKVKVSEVLVGAAVATFFFEVVKNLYVTYVTQFSVYTSVYGSVGSIVALLVWVYVSAIILLFGSLVTSRYSQYRELKREEERLSVKTSKAPRFPVRQKRQNYTNQ